MLTYKVKEEFLTVIYHIFCGQSTITWAIQSYIPGNTLCDEVEEILE